MTSEIIWSHLILFVNYIKTKCEAHSFVLVKKKRRKMLSFFTAMHYFMLSYHVKYMRVPCLVLKQKKS